MEYVCDIVVVGGGLSGSALASTLAEKGLEVIMVERRKGVEEARHALVLQPNGLEALSEMGVLGDLSGISEPIFSNVFYDKRHSVLASLDMRELGHHYAYFLPVLPDRLTESFRKRFAAKGGQLLEGFSFTSLLRDRNTVKGVKGVMGRETVEVRAKLVVGADGPLSKVRDAAGFQYRVNEYDDTYVVALLPSSIEEHKEVRLFTGRAVHLGVVPVNNRFTYIFYYLSHGDFERLKEAGLPVFKSLLVVLEPNLQHVLECLQDWGQVAHVKPIGVFCKTWVMPGLALIGDAAHGMNPSLGQGLNQSFVDIVVLSRILEECHQHNDFSFGALRKYEDSRLKHVLFYQRQSEVSASFLATNSRIRSWLGRRILRKMGKDKTKRILSLKMGSGLLSQLSLREQVSLLL